jgi:hypothetical protein
MYPRLSQIFWFSFNFVFGVLLFASPDLFKFLGIFVYMASLAGLAWNIREMKSDFLSQLRLMFLSAVGFYAGFVKILGEDVGFSGFGLHIQTFDIGVQMYAMTLIAISAIQIGYLMVGDEYRQRSRPLIEKISRSEAKIIYLITTPLIFLVGELSAKSYGPPVWISTYASGEGEGQLLGNLQAMGVILIGLNYLALSKLNNKYRTALSLSSYFYLLVWGILIRGGRLEFLSGIISLFVINKVINGKDRGLSLSSYLYLGVFAIFMEYLGHLRFALAGVEIETMFEGIARMLEDGFLFIGTISGIASAHANLMHMIKNNVIDYQWGLTYFDWMLRTPPEFLYPDRPKDLSSIFELYGYASIGGFFELAESYMNFGLVGVFFMSGAITIFFKSVQNKARNGNMLFYILLLAILSVFMRGAWYQTFAYYKSMVTGLLIYAALVLVLVTCKYSTKNNVVQS